MEEMKFVENPIMNEKVVEIVETLKEEIISNFHPKSIILSGSFGRGEATVSEENGKLKFLSDCEIIIIPYKYIFNRGKINEFEQDFYKGTGLKVEIWGATSTLYFLLPYLNKKMKPTMANYDLKYGSKVIYGKNYLGRMPDFKSEDMPLWEGIRLLFNRMAEALEHFSVENPSEEMVFWTDKIILACQDALLLSLGEYHYSYRKKNEMFQSLFTENFEELKKELPNFLDLTIEATERKVNGIMNIDDPIEYWFDTAKICDKVFRYVIRKDMGIEFKDYLEFQEKYLRDSNIGTNSRGFFSHPIYQNFIDSWKMFIVFKKFPSIAHIKNAKIPWKHIVYSAIPFIYFNSVLEESTPDFEKSVRDFALKNEVDSYAGFDYVKEKMTEKWRMMR